MSEKLFRQGQVLSSTFKAPGLPPILFGFAAYKAMMGFWLFDLTVFEVVALFAKCNAIRNIVAQIRVFSPRLDVVCYAVSAALLAALAGIVIAHEHSFAPVLILLSSHGCIALTLAACIVRVGLTSQMCRCVAPFGVIRASLYSIHPSGTLFRIGHLFSCLFLHIFAMFWSVLGCLRFWHRSDTRCLECFALFEGHRQALVSLCRFSGALNRTILHRMTLLRTRIVVPKLQLIGLFTDGTCQTDIRDFTYCLIAFARTKSSVAISYLGIVRQEVFPARFALAFD
jgi:hypothetical protein